jgi:hypothetical protein
MAPASHDDATAAARLGAALEMFDDGVAMMRLNLRRADAAQEGIERRLRGVADHRTRWIRTRYSRSPGLATSTPPPTRSS